VLVGGWEACFWHVKILNSMRRFIIGVIVWPRLSPAMGLASLCSSSLFRASPISDLGGSTIAPMRRTSSSVNQVVVSPVLNREWRQISGSVRDLNSVCAVDCRVLRVNFQDLVVILLFLEFLSVKV
jgi:hypothetical protein